MRKHSSNSKNSRNSRKDPPSEKKKTRERDDEVAGAEDAQSGKPKQGGGAIKRTQNRAMNEPVIRSPRIKLQ